MRGPVKRASIRQHFRWERETEMKMTTNELNDSLDDLLGIINAPKRAKELPNEAQFVRIRETVKEFTENCPKCRGTGRFMGWSGRPLGNCFACNGQGTRTFKTSPDRRARAREDRAALPSRRWEAFAEKYPAEAVWLREKAPRLEFAGSLIAAVERYGDLTENQLAAVRRGLVRDGEWRAAQEREQASPRSSAVDVANIVDCFRRAREAGLQRFTLRFDNVHFQADKTNPDLIWVSQSGYGSARYGRITRGAFLPGREANAEVVSRIVEIAKDPMAAAIAYAQVTNSCSVCGRHLENQDSVEAGIGPICAGRLNRPGFKFERVENI